MGSKIKKTAFSLGFKRLKLLGLGLFISLVSLVSLSPVSASAASYTAGRTTTSGSTMFTGQQNILSTTQVRTGAAAGSLASVSVYVGNVQVAPYNHMQVALYADTGSNMPGSRLAQSPAKVLQANSWNLFTLPAVAVGANTNYWLAFNVDGNATQVAITNVTGGRSVWKYPVSYGTWPTTYGSPNLSQAMQYSMYLTYTSETTPPPPTGCTAPPVAGVTTRSLTVNGVSRSYLLTVPAGLSANPQPVIMGFHGGSSTSEYARATYGLEGSANALYVYPQAPYWPEAGGVGWNVDPNGVDFPYFDAMLADLKTNYCVDSNRVFAAGKSNGGFFVNALACYRPGDVRAIASVAGGGPQNGCTAPKAAMIVHGTADPVVSISSGRYSRDYWLAANQYAGAAPVVVPPAPCVSYPGGLNPVIWCEHTGGHDWPTWAGAGIKNFFLSL